MPLRITRRPDTGALTITGTVAGQRIRRRAQTDDARLAREEAAALEAQILRTAWHGERRALRTLGEAARSYLRAAPRSEKHRAVIGRLLRALGNVPLSSINQQTAIALKEKMLRPDAAPGTYTRAVLMPLKAILNHAADQRWCEAPRFVMPRENPGRTRTLLPEEGERLIAAAAPHLAPLFLFLLCTGARMSEALGLEWRDVDLQGARAIFWAQQTKSGHRRTALVPARAIVSLAGLPGRDGIVFRAPGGEPYRTSRERGYGGQIKTGWRGAVRRAGLEPALTPHDLRHTWASWHYALNKDLLRLQMEGGWSSVALVERYAHLLPAGQEEAIARFLGTQRAPFAEVG